MTRRCLLVAALALSACSSTTQTLGASIQSPVAVAFFDGVTTKRPGVVHRYMAVASFAGSELRIVDPADDKVVVGPGLVFPLSVPTAPGPTFVAAADPGDAAPGALPGLLAVAGQQAPDAGSSPLQPALRIQIVATWNELTTTAPGLEVDLVSELAPADPSIVDAQLLSLVAMPVPGQPGRACLVAGLSGGRLAVVTYERDPASAASALRRVPGLPAQLVPARTVTVAVPAPGIPFDPLALALEPLPPVDQPATTRRLFAATGDVLGDRTGAEVHGVAEIVASFDASGAPATWSMRGLDALAPTRLVAAQWVSEREPTLQDAELFDGLLRLEVFAVLSESSCGPHHAISCGVATLVPDDPTRNGIAADPLGELPYRVPISIPGFPLAITAAAPRVGNGDYPPLDSRNAPNPLNGFRVMTIAPSTGRRDASALVAVASANGTVVFLDVGRFAAGNDTSQLRGVSRAGVRSLAVGGATGVFAPAVPLEGTANTTINLPAIVLWDDRAPATPGVHAKTVDTSSLTLPVPPARIEANVTATPGYAQDDTWSILWNGVLPGLFLRPGLVGRDPDGTAWVAIQSPGVDQTGTPIWIAGMNIVDPELGVRSRDGGPVTTGAVGDTVVISVNDPAVCPSHVDATTGATVLGELRATVVDFLPPSPDHPGGALQIDRVADPAAGADCPNPIVPIPPAGSIATTDVLLTVRGTDAVVAGATFGYAGRARISGTIVDANPTPIDNPPDTATIVAHTFQLRWEPEAPLQAIADDPLRTPADRRAAAERLAIARKARRNNYPTDRRCGAGIDVADPGCADWPAAWNPMLLADDERVVLKFRLAAYCRPNKLGITCVDGTGAVRPFRDDTGIQLSTLRGLREWSRGAPTGGSFPRSVGWIDKSIYSTDFSTQIVACYTDDQVVTYQPASSGGTNAANR